MANLVGKTLGKYHIVERLGRGGMAEVYKAYHAKLDRYVTVKILHSYLVDGPDFLPRFDREARAVASLRNPHIVQIHDYEVEDDNYYMVVEYIDGGNLQVRLDELSKAGAYMPIQQVLSILAQVSDALDYAHRQGIIHRDIKPSNILLDSKGNAFLCDFGIARIVGGTQVTTTGSLIGTPAYMSPEQGMGQELSDTSDIYSLGVVVYQLLTGKAPFVADTPLAIVQKQVTEPPVPPRLLRPDLPEVVDRVVARALAKKPADRYPTALDLLRDLEKAFPADVIKRLDAGAAPANVPLTAAPTIRMEEGEIPTPARAPEAKAQPSAPVPPRPPLTAKEPGIEPRLEVSTKAAAGAAAAQVSERPSAAGRKFPLRIILLAALAIGVVATVGVVALNAQGTQLLPAPIAPVTFEPTLTPWPTTGPTPTQLTAPPASPYAIDFESGKATGWSLDPGWQVTLDGDNHVLAGKGHYWADSGHLFKGDLRQTFRLKLLRGRIHMVVRLTAASRYYLGFDNSRTDMNKQYFPNEFHNDLIGRSAAHSYNRWYQVEILLHGSTIELLVDGKTQWSYTDPKPLTSGSFAFETLEDSEAYVDDISVEPLAEAP